ncbi:MAG TPA: hypothetical protein VHA79_09245 [Mycobacteriales bacterium]|nr:hypothetical protein [Mycobacteriales bacterium]
MAWFVGALSQREPENWDACKLLGLWGVPTNGRRRNIPAKAGDHLVIWKAGRGYMAEATVTGAARPPASRGEAPWPGGVVRFGLVLPITLVSELQRPIYLPFAGPRQAETGVTKAALQRGLALISDEGGELISRRLGEAAKAESAGIAT